jgi:hypothetical protein
MGGPGSGRHKLGIGPKANTKGLPKAPRSVSAISGVLHERKKERDSLLPKNRMKNPITGKKYSKSEQKYHNEFTKKYGNKVKY